MRRLQGHNLVRIGFLDEAGRSQHEPIMVVAGVLVHGDRTYRAITEHLRAIARRHIPEPDRENFLFHAKDIFQGARYFKDKEVWPRERRFPILRELAGTPAKFSLPVVFGHAAKKQFTPAVERVITALKPAKKHHGLIKDASIHGTVFAMAEIMIERQMHKFPRDEICILIAENTDRIKKAVKNGHAMLQSTKKMGDYLASFKVDGTPITKIVDTPHFAEKAESPPLQVADVCAYLILRRLRREASS